MTGVARPRARTLIIRVCRRALNAVRYARHWIATSPRNVPICQYGSSATSADRLSACKLDAGLQEQPNCTSAMAFLQGDCGNGRGAVAKVDVQGAQPSPVRSV